MPDDQSRREIGRRDFAGTIDAVGERLWSWP